MLELLTAKQMRRLEQAAINRGEVSGLALMERAGTGVVSALLNHWPDLAKTPYRAVILCGPGNNGGDGFVIARLLSQLAWAVDVFFLGQADKLSTEAKTNHDRWLDIGEITPLSLDAIVHSQIDQSADFIVIDALFGIGLTRVIGEEICSILSYTSTQGGFAKAPWVCVDTPSGICADSGQALWCKEPETPFETLTVTFHRAKLGHYLSEGPARSGKLKVCDIGLRETDPKAVCLASCSPAKLSKKSHQHKYDHGHAVILSGGVGKGGAARLAARGALRIGAGLVTLGCPASALMENSARLDAIMCRSIGDADALDKFLEDTRISSLCLGPGLGFERARAFVPVAMKHERPTVLDADALSAFADDPDFLFNQLHARCVLTPHQGEFARLFPDLRETQQKGERAKRPFSKIEAACFAAKRAGCTILLKGSDTVIASPDGRAVLNSAHYEREVPWLATAGAGDVLAGYICGLLARGVNPFDATQSSAWLHVECARVIGPGLIAEDLAEQLPHVLSAVGV